MRAIMRAGLTAAPALNEQQLYVRDVIDAHRACREAVNFVHVGHRFTIHPGVFSPLIAPSGRIGLSFGAWPVFRGRRVLDVGCGSGLLACVAALSGAATVVGVDVGRAAIRNAEENVAAHGLQRAVSIREGDLLDPIGRHEVFDLVFADLPFSSGVPRDELESAFFDEGLRSLRRLLRMLPVLLSHDPESARAYVCLSSFEPLQPLLEEVPPEVAAREVLRAPIAVADISLFEFAARP